MKNQFENKIPNLLLRALLNDELSDKEQTELKQWMAEGSGNQQMWDRMHSNRFWEKELTSLKEVNAEVGIRHFQKIKKRRRLLYWSKIAAIVFPFTFAVLWSIQYANNKGIETSKEILANGSVQIKSGGTKALLLTEEGKLYNLGDENLELTDGDLTVKIEGGTVRYSDNPIEEMCWHTLSVPRGGEYRLELADGTKVWLNAETELRFPVAFGENERRIFLKGEAYFEVAKDEGRPFIVKVDDMSIKVYGTQFNINTHNKNKIETVLVSGSVGVEYNNKEVILEPAQKAEVSLESGDISIVDVDVMPYIGWKEGNFMFQNESLESIMEKLCRWYDLDVFYSNNAVKGLRFSGILKRYKDVSDLFYHLEKISSVQFTIKGNTVIIE